MDNDVEAIGDDGAAVLVTKPSVTTEGGGAADESFSTESTSSVPNDDDPSDAANLADVGNAGPFSGFRRRRAERIAARISLREEREAERRKALEERKKVEEAIPERLIETDNLDSSRAGTISVTVVKNGSNSYGMGLAEVPHARNRNRNNTKQNAAIKIDALIREGETLLRDSPLCEGDILKTVNNEPVTGYRSVMLKLMGMNGPVTIVVEPAQARERQKQQQQQQQQQPCNPAMVRAFCRKPTPETDLGISFGIVEHSTTQNALCQDPSGTQDITTTKLLQIKSIDPNGLLSHSALREGDFCLAINDRPCHAMSAQDASDLLQNSESSIVTIVALNPQLAREHCSPTRAQRWLRRMRRTGVGVAGGTMLGLGLIMIPLPFPPPFGEVLVLGGVSVLGTEFEAPKKVVRSARNALQNAVRGNEAAQETERLRQMESVADNSGDSGDECGSENSNNHVADNGENETTTSTATPGEQQQQQPTEEPVVLRESFMTMMSHRQLLQPNDDGSENEIENEIENENDKETPQDITDCWSQANIDLHNASMENLYSGTEHKNSASPTTTPRQFFHNVGRNVVLPFLDHVVGDEKKTEDEDEDAIENKNDNDNEIKNKNDKSESDSEVSEGESNVGSKESVSESIRQ